MYDTSRIEWEQSFIEFSTNDLVKPHGTGQDR